MTDTIVERHTIGGSYARRLLRYILGPTAVIDQIQYDVIANLVDKYGFDMVYEIWGSIHGITVKGERP